MLRDPAILARVLEEQQQVLGGNMDTPLTWEHLGEMELLHNVMRETLRMYPPLVRHRPRRRAHFLADFVLFPRTTRDVAAYRDDIAPFALLFVFVCVHYISHI